MSWIPMGVGIGVATMVLFQSVSMPTAQAEFEDEERIWLVIDFCDSDSQFFLSTVLYSSIVRNVVLEYNEYKLIFQLTPGLW